MVATGPSVSARSLAAAGFVALLVATTIAPAGEIELPSLPPEALDNGVVPAYVPEGVATNDDGVVRTANVVPMGGEGVIVDGGPVSVASAGSYFNPTLGQHIRARYNTRSYGQEDGNLDLGTMGLWEMNGGFGFFDGQVTMNDEQNVGYNIGLGYRWLTLPILPTSPDGAKIAGVSVWADGQGVDSENFFPQVGVSLELLGDRIDLRANGYIPVGPSSRVRDFVGLGDELTFTGNSIAAATVGVQDTPLTVGEIEAAGRIGDLDAWVFGGVYAFDGGPYSEVGGKVGLRGYATHDVLLSIAIANDDLFDTNAIFSATWFIGRTRNNNCPTGRLEDRFREPVLRNDYVAIRSDAIAGAAAPLTNADGSELNIVFVDSDAAAGGDGTFENPLNSVNDIAANSQENSVILLTANSTFSGETVALQDGQFLLGEGMLPGATDPFANTITTAELGTITLPETFAGASSAAAPILQGVAADAVVTLADGNTVQNLDFRNNQTAIQSDTTNGTIGATINNLEVSGHTGVAMLFDGTDGAISVDATAFSGNTGPAVRADANNGSVSIGTTSSIVDTTGNAVEIVNNLGAVAVAANITTDAAVTGGTVLVDGSGIVDPDTQGTVTLTGDIQSNNASAISIQDNLAQVTSSGAVSSTGTGDTIAYADTDDTTASGQININGTVTNDPVGRSISIDGGDADINFNGNVTDNGEGIAVVNRTGGEVEFTAQTTLNTTTNDAVTLTNNDETSAVLFNGGAANSGLAITTTSGSGIVGSAGAGTSMGGLSVTGTANTLVADSGQALVLSDGSSTAGVTFDSITVTDSGANSAIELVGFDGTVTANDGELTSNTNTASVTDASLTLAGVDLTATAGGNAVVVNQNSDTARAVAVSDGSLNGGGISVQNSGSATQTADFTDLTAVAATSFQATDTGDLTATMNNVASTGDTVVAATNTGNAGLTVDNNSTIGAATVTATNDGNAQLTATDVTMSGALVASASGAGDATTNLTRVTGVTTATLTGTGDGGISATLDDVTMAGALAAGVQNDTGTVTLTDVTGLTDVTTSTIGSGNMTATLTDVAAGGAVTSTASGAGDATTNLTRVTGVTTATFTGTGGGGITADFDDVDMGGAFTANVQNDTGTVTLNELTGVTDITTNSTGSGNLTTTLTDFTMAGAITAAASGAGNVSVQATDIDGVTDIDLDSTGAGNISGNLTRVSNAAGTTNIAINGTGDGAASLTANSVNTGGTLTADATGDGGLTVFVSNSGGTQAFDAISVTESGNGATLATFNNVTSDANLTFNSSGNGDATLNVTGGSYATGIDADATNTGTFTSSITGAGLDGGNLDINAGNTGNVDFTITGLAFDTGANIDAIAMTLGAGVAGGDILVSNNTNVRTLDGNAFVLNSTGGGIAAVNFQLSGNTFTNASGTERTALIDIAGTQTVNATITSNTVRDTTGTVAYQLEVATTAGNPRLNLNLAANNAISGGGLAGSGSILVREDAGQIHVFERDDTFNNVGQRNDATVDFDPNNLGDFGDLANPPTTP